MTDKINGTPVPDELRERHVRWRGKRRARRSQDAPSVKEQAPGDLASFLAFYVRELAEELKGGHDHLVDLLIETDATHSKGRSDLDARVSAAETALSAKIEEGLSRLRVGLAVKLDETQSASGGGFTQLKAALDTLDTRLTETRGLLSSQGTMQANGLAEARSGLQADMQRSETQLSKRLERLEAALLGPSAPVAGEGAPAVSGTALPAGALPGGAFPGGALPGTELSGIAVASLQPSAPEPASTSSTPSTPSAPPMPKSLRDDVREASAEQARAIAAAQEAILSSQLNRSQQVARSTADQVAQASQVVLSRLAERERQAQRRKARLVANGRVPMRARRLARVRRAQSLSAREAELQLLKGAVAAVQESTIDERTFQQRAVQEQERGMQEHGMQEHGMQEPPARPAADDTSARLAMLEAENTRLTAALAERRADESAPASPVGVFGVLRRVFVRV